MSSFRNQNGNQGICYVVSHSTSRPGVQSSITGTQQQKKKRIKYSLHTVRTPTRSCWVNIKCKPAVLFRQSKKSRFWEKVVVVTMVVGLFHTASTWRWCCCERRCPSLHKLLWPTQLWAWRRTWHCTHQRRPGSSTPQAQTCPGRHPCTWASPSPYRPADQRLDIYIPVDEVENGPISAHLVEPADEAQAACCCLRRVQARGASCVVVVDLCCLGDAVQQIVVRYGVTEGQILAHHLENIKRFERMITVRLPELKHVVLFHEKVVVLWLVKHPST